MFDIINQAMLYLLNLLKDFTGSYGLAIIAVTVLIRVALWPMNSAQSRSMKKMQELQPKLKQLQERYKDQPQKMQEAMMKFYAENRFNPFAGCLPLVVQIPIFIGLYGALNSPDFLAHAGGEHFLFINKLYNTLQSHAGKPLDNEFNIRQGDKFQTGKVALIYLKDGKTLEQPVPNPGKVLVVKPQPLIPGEPISFELPTSEFQFSPDFVQRINYVQTSVINMNSREIEQVQFKPVGNVLAQSLPTVEGKNTIHMDVLVLVILYGILTLLYQQTMQKGSAAAMAQGDQGQAQAQLMKFMPLMFVGMLFFIPIPAGVMLYLVVTTAMMYGQTAWIHWKDGHSGGGDLIKHKPSDRIIDIKPDGA